MRRKYRHQNVGAGRPKRLSSSSHHGQQHQTDHDAAQAEKPDLAIAESEYLLEHAAPAARGDERQDPFNHQHQRQRLPEGVSVHRVYFLAVAAPLPEPEPRIALKKSDEGSSTITSLFLLKLAL